MTSKEKRKEYWEKFQKSKNKEVENNAICNQHKG